ncbi:DUF4244 domain-containing protein [Leucobacter chinensis]|uniref:DUF4244 domain-containing protein n=1 Tax=Leucobacter chinensis TaxID=2851010 RepID=UPI001C219117
MNTISPPSIRPEGVSTGRQGKTEIPGREAQPYEDEELAACFQGQSPSLLSQRLLSPLQDEKGAATAEYAIVIMAAVALAGVLVAIMRSGEVQAMLLNLVQQAFSAAG